ncbi:MAG: ATP-binding protein, partial [Planctomycetia bacterium]
MPNVWAKDVERSTASFLAERLQNDVPRRFQLILGPRRVGKTTVMWQTVRRLLEAGIPRRRLWWLRLDHPLLMRFDLGALIKSVLNAASGFGAPSPEDPIYFFLDELTYSDGWDLWLKTFYDESWPVRVVGTSSSTAALRDRRLESGVGR